MKTLFLYTTSGCHLCEQAEALVRPVLPAHGLVLEKIDIAESEDLMARYGLRIPVLRVEDESRDLGWPFSREDFEEWVEKPAS